MVMKILLFGKNGQVGWELQRSLAVLGEVTAVDWDGTEHCGDFANTEGVLATVRALQPDVIVNAAAHTAVDKAESEPERARVLNATTPGQIALEAARLGLGDGDPRAGEAPPQERPHQGGRVDDQRLPRGRRFCCQT